MTTETREKLPRALTLKERCALAYAARILYTIPVNQWSNACDMVEMLEGHSVGRNGYILGQAVGMWDAAGNNFPALWDDAEPDAESVTFWEGYIAEQVAIVKAADAEDNVVELKAVS